MDNTSTDSKQKCYKTVLEKLQLALLIVTILAVICLGYLLNEEHKKTAKQIEDINNINATLKKMTKDINSLKSNTDDLEYRISDLEDRIYWEW